MKNLIVTGMEAEDINQQVHKVLRGLGNPDPPLRLEDVRELLRLDRQFYSSGDTSAVRETISRIKVAGKQILSRPSILWDAIRKADLSALYLPDRRRILIDADKPKLKHRWSEAHEIGHSIISWHAEMNLGDTTFTLKPECHEVVEAEANFAAGQLLFLQGKFLSDARDCERTLAAVKSLAKLYGNTITSTLWRFAESMALDVALVGIVSKHPRYPADDFDPANPCRYCIQSPRFRRQFSRLTESELFEVILGYCRHGRRGPLGDCDVNLEDDNGTPHSFHFESFCNTHEVLTLGVHLREAGVVVTA